MNIIISSILYLLSGFLMKLADDQYDEFNNKKLAIIFGILCGIIIAILSSSSIDAAYLFFAILIGNLVAFKVDGIHHILTLASFLIVIYFLGFPVLNIVLLAICTIAAFVDEIGNDNEKIAKKSNFLKLFFDYRCFMKLVVLLLSLLGLQEIYTGLSFSFMPFFAPETIILFMFFETAYEIAGKIGKDYLN